MRAKKGPQTSLLVNNIVQTIIFNHRILFVKGFFYIPSFFLLHEAYYISKYLNCCLWMQEREVSMWQWWNVFKAYFYRVLIRSHLLQDATEVVPSDRYTKSWYIKEINYCFEKWTNYIKKILEKPCSDECYFREWQTLLYCFAR